MIRSRHFLIFIFLTIILSGCLKLRDDLSWDTNLSIPLLQSRLDLQDIFGDTLTQVNPNQSVSLVISQQLAGLDLNGIFDIDDTLARDMLAFQVYYPVAPGIEVIRKESDFHLKLNDIELIEARVKTATLKFIVTNTLKQPLLIRYEILSSSKDGSTFYELDSIPPATASGSITVEKSINLSDYTLDFTGRNHNQSNMVISKTNVWLHPKADTVQWTPNDTILVVSVFDEMEIDYARGYFGQLSERQIDTTRLNTFGNFISGSFDLQNVDARLEISNGLGVDVQMKLNSLKSINSKTGTTIPFNHPIVGGNLNILRANESNQPTNSVIHSNYLWDLSNSNIADMVENQPDMLAYDIQYLSNPLGNISGGNDFIYFGHSITGTIFMEIPLHLNINNLVIEEPTSMDISKLKKMDEGVLNIFTSNLFPFDVDLQFFILDQNGSILDSLIKGNLTSNAGVVNSQGFVTSPTDDILQIPIDNAMIEKLKSNSQILVRAKIRSNLGGKIQLYNHYHIDIKVVLEGKYEI